MNPETHKYLTSLIPILTENIIKSKSNLHNIKLSIESGDTEDIIYIQKYRLTNKDNKQYEEWRYKIYEKLTTERPSFDKMEKLLINSNEFPFDYDKLKDSFKDVKFTPSLQQKVQIKNEAIVIMETQQEFREIPEKERQATQESVEDSLKSIIYQDRLARSITDTITEDIKKPN